MNDQTGINYWMEWRFPVLMPRTFLYPVGSATLGYGVPAAIGAKIARPDRPGGLVVGDGGFMYSVNELATAVKYRLPVVFLVMNDDRYGAIKWLQQTLFDGRWGEADLDEPRFPGAGPSVRGARRARERAWTRSARALRDGARRRRADRPRAEDDGRPAVGDLSATASRDYFPWKRFSAEPFLNQSSCEAANECDESQRLAGPVRRASRRTRPACPAPCRGGRPG